MPPTSAAAGRPKPLLAWTRAGNSPIEAHSAVANAILAAKNRVVSATARSCPTITRQSTEMTVSKCVRCRKDF
jgi:hypothetical protein